MSFVDVHSFACMLHSSALQWSSKLSSFWPIILPICIHILLLLNFVQSVLHNLVGIWLRVNDIRHHLIICMLAAYVVLVNVHIFQPYQMREIATVILGVCQSVCRGFVQLCCANVTEWIKVLPGMETLQTKNIMSRWESQFSPRIWYSFCQTLAMYCFFKPLPTFVWKKIYGIWSCHLCTFLWQPVKQSHRFEVKI